MSILLGSEYKYNKEFCKPLKYRRTIPLSKILKQIKKELEELNISVLRPKKKKMPFCTSLWTRDSFININNKLIMLPLQALATRHPDEWKTIPAASKRRKMFPDSPENLEGGDVIQDGNRILVGLGKRTNNDGVSTLRKMFPNKKITVVNHCALHLDCCLMILPGKRLIYSTRYISNLPKILKSSYDCTTVESIIGKDTDPLLATNGLLIGNNIITTDQIKFKKFRNFLRSLGFNVIEIKYGTLWREEGGIRCLTQWLDKPREQKIC